AEMTEKTYQRLIELGIMLAQQGYPVILDAKFDQQHWRREAIAQASANHLPLKILHCTAPIETVRDRLIHRQGDITDATVELLEHQMTSAEPFTAEALTYVQHIDTSHPLATIVESLI
ncbi:MAG: AAA family ATPase, partial [Symploca sp. SIO2B6]|nr:AAA family ATPase [Symploca sp. SIO2B6]